MSDITKNNQFPSNGPSRDGLSNGRSDSDSKKDPDEINLKQLFYTLWHNKWIIISSVVFFCVLAAAYSYTVTPIYQSDGTIIITQQQNRYSYAGSDIANLLTSTYGVGIGSTISNELQVMRSRDLSLEMADTLINRRLVDNGRQYPVLFTAYPEDSTMAERSTVAKRLRNNLSFSQIDQEADMVSISYQSPSPLEAADVVDLTMNIYTDISTRQNRRSASSAVSFLENERGKIQERLGVAEEQLRNFMDREKLVQVDAQTEEIISRMATLESKRQEARVGLVTVNSGVEQYRERLDNIKPGLSEQYADAVGPNMMRLQYQLAELEIERMQYLTNNQSLRDNSSNPPAQLREIDNKIEMYKQRIRELADNLIAEGDEYLGFLDGSDGNIAQAVTELNGRLIELQVEQQQYQSQIEVIDEQLAGQRSFFDQLPDNMIELARLKRDVTINEELFLTVSQQFAEMSLWEQTQFGLGRPVDEGYVPGNPVKPNKKLYILVGFILGGILSVGFIFIREAFNTTIDSIGKIRSFGLPLLTVIPLMDKFIGKKYDGKNKVTIQDRRIPTTMVTLLDTISPISESFRRLESNIIYSNPDKKMKSLMITSSTQGEGKTTVSANLGVVLAEAGYSVCIVDADLRRPNLHSMFGLKEKPGLVETLFDNLNVEESIQQTLHSNLHILSSGRRPPNPSAITQSRAFLDLIAGLEEEYDYVIIDTAPFGIITDASALISQTDGVVVISKFGSTEETELQHTLENLNRLKAEILGVVLSSFDSSSSTDYYYGAQYAKYYRKISEDYSSYHTD